MRERRGDEGDGGDGAGGDADGVHAGVGQLLGPGVGWEGIITHAARLGYANSVSDRKRSSWLSALASD